MIVVFALLLGAVFGGFRAHKRGGNRFDVAQYAAVYGIIFAVITILLTIMINR